MACSRISLQRLALPSEQRVHKISYYLESVAEKIIGMRRSAPVSSPFIGYKLHLEEILSIFSQRASVANYG
jgi:hypothetical protein